MYYNVQSTGYNWCRISSSLNYGLAYTFGEVYTNSENTEYDQSIDDFESENRTCHNSRSALVQFTTETVAIEWAPVCNDDIPELFDSVQCGFDSQVTDVFCWCADTTSGKRLSAVNLISIFDRSTCE